MTGYQPRLFRLVCLTGSGVLRCYEAKSVRGCVDRIGEAKGRGDVPLEVQWTQNRLAWIGMTLPVFYDQAPSPKKRAVIRPDIVAEGCTADLWACLPDPRQLEPVDILIAREESDGA